MHYYKAIGDIMKTLTLTFSLIAALTSTTVMASTKSYNTKSNDFTMSIKDARAEQQRLLESYKSEYRPNAQPQVTQQEVEVYEFLNSEIHWKSPKQNAKK
jgi:hypothetical protein